jgi:HipA-like protein
MSNPGPLRTVCATRYVTPLREGGSLPAIVEASDLGLYVLKFRGAGQGPLALVAELLAGEIGRALGLPVPELVLIEVDAALGRNEEDPEIRDLLRASVGLNLGLDFLPGAAAFDPAVDRVEADLASRVVWFDAFVTNVDRTPRNANLLWWHRSLYLIDHGAALYFHHNRAPARSPPVGRAARRGRPKPAAAPLRSPLRAPGRSDPGRLAAARARPLPGREPRRLPGVPHPAA